VLVRAWTVALASALASPVLAAQLPAAGAVPTALATPVVQAPSLDGRLDEAVWATASPLGTLRQQDPEENAAASEETEVRVLFTPQALYVGIRCHDRTPSGIVATQLTRDAILEADDYVLVLLDPLLDGRNGFFFEVNPAGARTDGQVANNAETLNPNWDGVWDAAARITDDGWSAEIEIPFKTLRFNPHQTTWGLNVERHIKRKNETDRWASARRDVWIGNLAEAGRLEGLTNLAPGHGLDLRPYLAGGDTDHDGQLDVGLDAFQRLTATLNGALTINTDFAETEVDARQVNLTRFPLFFPEKRAFFLEGAGVFDLAGLGSSNTDLVPFFSRRIGLADTGEPIPIRAGAKVIGRQGDYNIGVLDVYTGHTDLGPTMDTRQNLFVGRVTRNLLRQSWVGAIVTHGNPTGGGENTMVGADARFATSEFRGGKNLSLDVYLLRTSGASTSRADVAGGFRVDYPNDRWDLALSWKHIGDSFDPALGFVPRRGIRRATAGIEYMPRPHCCGIRQFFFEFRPEYVTDLGNRVQSWRIFTAPLNLRTESAEHLEWNYIPQYEHLDAPFEIRPGVVIPVGSYQWTRYRTEVNTATKRRWVVDAAYWWGGFYDGTLRELEVGLTIKPSAHLLVNASVSRNDVDVRAGRFHTQILALRGDYNISPDVSWATLVQYDNDSRLLGFQGRFRWILKPGNDLFLVFNRGWERLEDGSFVGRFERAAAKLQYTFRW
jgi:hypothetical protein